MANPKRVSIKGRGADIFFGDYVPSQPEASPSAPPDQAPGPDSAPSIPEQPLLEEQPVETAQEGSMLASMQASKRESKHASKQASRQVSKHASMPASLPEAPPAPRPTSPLASEVLNGIAAALAERATITNAFRYTDQELTWLTDALYEITKRHKVKLSKQDIARLGLNAVLWDWRVRGDESLLGHFVREREARKAGR